MIRRLLLVGLLAAVTACSDDRAAPDAAAPAVEPPAAAASTHTPESIRAATASIDGARIRNADREPGNWLTHGRTYDEQRYSPGDQPIVVDGVCCDVVNRGVAVWKGKVYVGTLDGRLIALDAATGEPSGVQTIDPTSPTPSPARRASSTARC
jgi:glucose dehydrogenase